MYTDDFFHELTSNEIVFKKMPVKSIFYLFELYIQEQSKPDPEPIQRLIYKLEE